MKTLIILVVLILCFSNPALANQEKHGYYPQYQKPVPQHRHNHNYYNHNYNYQYRDRWNWVAPAIVGGVIGYTLTRPDYYVEPRSYETVCGEWREIRNWDGTVIRERTCYQR